MPVLLASVAAVSPATAKRPLRNLVREWRPAITERDVDTKLAGYWQALFEGDEAHRVVHPAAPTPDGPAAYVLDTVNGDVRSEGMSYGMMIAVQTGHKASFDALWNWAATYMRYRAGPRAGYFRWSCRPTGCVDDAAPASDGEEYIATALLMAAARWKSGLGIYDYERQAQSLLDAMLHKQDMNGGVIDGVTDLFDQLTDQVVFVPVGESATFTDPSYHLPAFYQLWATRAAGWRGARMADRRRWRRIAAASRRFLAKSAHPITALTPDYAEFDGRPRPIDGHGDFRYDALRTAMNWSVDHAWWGRNPAAVRLSERLQRFFIQQGPAYPARYRLNGEPLGRERSNALIAANAVASLALMGPPRAAFIAPLWAMAPPTGPGRYYDGMIQFMALLHVTGRFRP
ncbi:glycosyl hydrolase family 8 [Sphingomonas sp. 1P08PE]|uniref:glycosyl hydrolase family 8 n=1 Tax=Sphingomonas sp. 1P08PE TaxID=554122 RepID=UPI0039A278F6